MDYPKKPCVERIFEGFAVHLDHVFKTCKWAGDYLIPDLAIKENDKLIGKYGRMRLRYLREHRKGLYTVMMLNGILQDHLAEMAARLPKEVIDRYVVEKWNAQQAGKEAYKALKGEWKGMINRLIEKGARKMDDESLRELLDSVASQYSKFLKERK